MVTDLSVNTSTPQEELSGLIERVTFQVKFQQRYEKRHGNLANLLRAKELCLRGTLQLSARFKQPILGA
jgi:hypothetical protein